MELVGGEGGLDKSEKTKTKTKLALLPTIKQ